jgi:GNAT superfamily N-acetyltransferase
MIIRRAGEADVPAISGMRAEARRWLASLGSDQWQRAWPDEATAEARLAASIAAGGTWIVEDDGDAIATLALDDFSDPHLWTPEEQAEPARYLHRLVVARRNAGSGLGARLIDWACDRAAREGARWVRIDVWTTNEDLQRYYVSQGFQHIGTLTDTDYPSGALFQRAARAMPPPGLREIDTQSDNRLE